jgi:putative IMPACT (imprinted ancient) family translation regulator
VVVTRYFGGTKLGTGGLVRAYGDAARHGLASLPTETNILKKMLGLEVPYPIYERVKRLIGEHQGTIEDETFAADVTLMVNLPEDTIGAFTQAIRNLSNGQVEPVVLDG